MTQVEALQAIQKQRTERLEDGWTVEEYAEFTGVKGSRARERIRNGCVDGTIIHVGFRHGVTVMGARHLSPTYKFVGQ